MDSLLFKIVGIVAGISTTLFGISCLAFKIVVGIKEKEIKQQAETIKTLESSVNNQKEIIDKLKGEIKIEKNHKEILAKRLADIDNMSIDDVLHELQND